MNESEREHVSEPSDEELIGQLARVRMELDQLTYAISHDLRAPLRTVFGFVQLLERKYGDRLEGQALDYLDRINSGMTRMESMIDGLLQLSRTGRVDIVREEVDLSALAGAVIGELRAAEPGRNVETSIAPGVVVSGDMQLLRTALHHLLGNAWKFTARTAAPRIEFGVREVGGETFICVRDNGAGFTMNQVDRLFRPFQRLHLDTEFPGIGMGLALVGKIIERHGGTVRAEGVEGGGALFCFTIGNSSPG